MNATRCFLLVLSVSSVSSAPADLSAQELRLEEHFGVSHPEQIVRFDRPASFQADRAILIDDQGREAACQAMSDGTLAVRTDLPAGAKRCWSLRPGSPKPVEDRVTIVPGQGWFEVANGLIAVRVAAASDDKTRTPSAIQGVRYRDGAWTATGPNFMPRPARSMRVDWLDKGPLVARAKITYGYDRAELRAQFEKEVIPAGEGTYTTTIEVQTGQPSILFEEESDVDIFHSFDVYAGLSPDRAQYRGHHATAPEAGHEPDGKTYAYGNSRHDALVDLNYQAPATHRFSHTTYPFLSHWDPWGVDTGFYWQLYASSSDAGDNLLGLFAGRTSRLHTPGLSGVSIDTNTRDGRRRCEVRVTFQRLMPTQRYARQMRFAWGLFLGRKSADLRPPKEVQGVNRQMNLHAGVNLTALASLPAEYADPPSGYGSLYVEPEVCQRLKAALQAEAAKKDKTLFNRLSAVDPYFRDIVEFWRQPSAEQAAKAARAIQDYARSFLDVHVHGEGIYKHDMHYFTACLNISARLIWLDELLSSELLSPEDKARLKRIAALWGHLLWNNDLAAMQEDSGMNWGPQNMASMWFGTRYAYTLFLAHHPLFQDRARQVKELAVSQFREYINEDGACTACAHYAGASMTPILNLFQQLQTRGVFDPFASETRLKRYSEWEMQLMTPPEVRFGGLRKIIAVGDGSTESSTRPAQLGTGLAAADPALSTRLMGAWKSMGSPHSGFFGSSIVKIDEGLPAVSPRLASDQFQGWMSVLRTGWDTPQESAVFFVNGNHLSDHRHNDNGTLVLYALGAPLSLDWGPIYYPRVDGGLMHSIAVPESGLKQPWDADNTPLDWPHYMAPWQCLEQRPLVALGSSTAACARFAWPSRKELAWQRSVWLVHFDPERPVIVIDDMFSGAKEPMISTLNLVAQGEVATPRGPVRPEERLYDHRESKPQMPSAGKRLPLAAGLNRFRFRGQWLIDWDLYVQAPGPIEAAIGNWGHRWNPSTEAGQFAKSQGRPFEERQHILRLRGAERFRTVVLPYLKDHAPDPLQVETQGQSLRVRSGDATLTIGPAHCDFQRAETKGLATYDASAAEAHGIRIEGGPAEVILRSDKGSITVAGPAGDRRIVLPAGWSVAAPAGTAAIRDGAWHFHHAGARPATWQLRTAK